MKKVSDDVMPELARLYNSEGQKSLYRCLREQYGIQQPSSFFNRMKSSSKLAYDAQADVFGIEASSSDGVFLSMDELCAGTLTKYPNSTIRCSDKSEEMTSLIQELIGERLLELNRYVKLDARSRTVLVDATSLRNDGYNIVNH